MPIGIILDCFAVLLGGIIGDALANKISESIKNTLNNLFGFIAIAIGITLVVKVQNLGAAVLSIIIGTIIGSLLELNQKSNNIFNIINTKLLKNNNINEENVSQINILFVLCCFSGTGVFGAMNEALNSDHSIIICKAILDFFTVIIFSTKLGKITSTICVPQALVFILLFVFAKQLTPVMTLSIKNDFSCVGGIIELIIALKILKLTNLEAINSLPSLILIIPISYLWQLLVQMLH